MALRHKTRLIAFSTITALGGSCLPCPGEISTLQQPQHHPATLAMVPTSSEPHQNLPSLHNATTITRKGDTRPRRFQVRQLRLRPPPRPRLFGNGVLRRGRASGRETTLRIRHSQPMAYARDGARDRHDQGHGKCHGPTELAPRRLLGGEAGRMEGRSNSRRLENQRQGLGVVCLGAAGQGGAVPRHGPNRGSWTMRRVSAKPTSTVSCRTC